MPLLRKKSDEWPISEFVTDRWVITVPSGVWFVNNKIDISEIKAVQNSKLFKNLLKFVKLNNTTALLLQCNVVDGNILWKESD